MGVPCRGTQPTTSLGESCIVQGTKFGPLMTELGHGETNSPRAFLAGGTLMSGIRPRSSQSGIVQPRFQMEVVMRCLLMALPVLTVALASAHAQESKYYELPNGGL